MGNWLTSWHRSLQQWLTLVAKANCPLCQRATSQAFCLDCQRQVQQCRLAPPTWQQQAELSILAWGRYDGALKRAIAAMKYHNQPELAVALGHWLAQSWPHQAGKQSAIVVPIPMHEAKRQQRGFNQAELLADSFCAMTGLICKPDGLRRIRETEAQFRLSHTARVQNLRDAFALGPAFLHHPPTRPVLLLDDIYTTGATARSAARTLRSQGIRVQGIMVLAIAVSDQATSSPRPHC
ncbi:MAG: ComF family protein [Leptolyngbyaceae cyanobacterium bins.349]|nr:ComF family protein [Leptolyngbyaceae cyanobacterium bins.349]